MKRSEMSVRRITMYSNDILVWTTCRYASLETRKKAQALADQSKSKYVARGKKTIDELAFFARRSGFARVMVLEESEKKPALIRFIEIFPDGKWKWKEEIKLENYEVKNL